MKLTKTAEYAIGVMSELGKAEGSLVSAKNLHETLQIPYRYTTKVLRLLLQAKLVSTEQGREGGYCLAKPPNEIMLSDIIEAVEPQTEYCNCIMGRDRCNSDKPCALHSQWAHPRELIRKMFQDTPLSQL